MNYERTAAICLVVVIIGVAFVYLAGKTWEQRDWGVLCHNSRTVGMNLDTGLNDYRAGGK